MLSGALALDNTKNRNYKYYYRKEFRNIGVVTLIVSIMYLVYGVLRVVATGLVNSKPVFEILRGGVERLTDFIIGKPFYHLWYLYMMIGIFILVPIIIRFKNDIGENTFTKGAVVFFIVSTFGLYTSTHELMWDPGFSFGFLGYFIMGYVIRKKVQDNNRDALILIIGGVLVLLGVAYFLYTKGVNGIGNKELLDNLTGASALPVAIASILIFVGFSKLKIRKSITKLSKQSFEIYLFHAGIWDVCSIIITKDMDSKVVIPLMIVIVSVLAWAMTIFWQYLWKLIEVKWGVSDKLCKFLKLNE